MEINHEGMPMLNKIKTHTPLLALILFVFSVGYVEAANKVVVIPMAADSPPEMQWALIKGSDSTIIRQSGGISVTKFSTGIYRVNFGKDVRGHALSAMLQSGSYDRVITAQICGNDGTLETVLCGGSSNNTSTLSVHIRGTVTTGWIDGTFYIAVLP